MKRSAGAIAVVMLGLACSRARAAEDCIPNKLPWIQTLAAFTGRYVQATYLDKATETSDEKLTAVGYRSGRSAYTFKVKPDLDVVFTGGKSGKPDPKLHELEVDKLSVSRNGEQIAMHPARGVCSMKVEDKNAAVIRCSAEADGKKTAFEFVAEGQPSILQFCPPGK